jgi:hypothetical protein
MHSPAPHEHSYPHLWHMPSTRHQTLLTKINTSPGQRNRQELWMADP